MHCFSFYYSSHITGGVTSDDFNTFNAISTQHIVDAVDYSIPTTKVKKITVFHGGMIGVPTPRMHASGPIQNYAALVCQQTVMNTNIIDSGKAHHKQAKRAYWGEYCSLLL